MSCCLIKDRLRLLAQHDADEQHLAVNRANDSISECISLSPEASLHFDLLEHLVKYAVH